MNCAIRFVTRGLIGRNGGSVIPPVVLFDTGDVSERASHPRMRIAEDLQKMYVTDVVVDCVLDWGTLIIIPSAAGTRE